MEETSPQSPMYFPISTAKLISVIAFVLLTLTVPVTVFLVNRQQKIDQEAALPVVRDIGLVIKPAMITATAQKGTTVKVADLISTTATAFTLHGYPTSYGPTIRWTQLAGSIQPGQALPLSITVNDSVPQGTYTGTAIITNQEQQTKFFQVTITVE